MPAYTIRDHDTRRHARLTFTTSTSRKDTLALWIALEVDHGNGQRPKFLGGASLDADQSAVLVRAMRGSGPDGVAVAGLLSDDMTVRVDRYPGGFVFTLLDNGKTLREITVLDTEVDKIARNLAFDLRVTTTPTPTPTAVAEQRNPALKPIAGSPPGAPTPPFPV